MKTFMANDKVAASQRKWYVVDAAGQPLGRLASQVAAVLRGKNKPIYTPHVDTGDYVIVINTDKVALTGKKLEQKFKRHHTLYMGGLKEVQYKKYIAENSDDAVYTAVKGMLPKGPLGRQLMDNLYVYEGTEHNHEAQKPKAIDINQYK